MKLSFYLSLFFLLALLSIQSCKKSTVKRAYYTMKGESKALYQQQYIDSLGVHAISWDSVYQDWSDALMEFDQNEVMIYTSTQHHLCAMPDSVFTFQLSEDGKYSKIYTTHWIVSFTLTDDSLTYSCTNYGGVSTGNFTSTSLQFKGKRQ